MNDEFEDADYETQVYMKYDHNEMSPLEAIKKFYSTISKINDEMLKENDKYGAEKITLQEYNQAVDKILAKYPEFVFSSRIMEQDPMFPDVNENSFVFASNAYACSYNPIGNNDEGKRIASECIIREIGDPETSIISDIVYDGFRSEFIPFETDESPQSLEDFNEYVSQKGNVNTNMHP